MIRRFFYLVPCFVVLFLASAAKAGDSVSTDPLRLVPDSFQLFAKIERPEKILELVTRLYSLEELQGLSAYREFYQSTTYRRITHVVSHFEKRLGRPWQELVTQLAGGGAVAAVKLEPSGQDAATILIVQSKDPELMQKFVKTAIDLFEEEVARQTGIKVPLNKKPYQGIDVIHLDQAHVAAIGSTLIFSNTPKPLEAAIDLHVGKSNKSLANLDHVRQAKQLLPPDPLVWAWLNIEKTQQIKDVLDAFNGEVVTRFGLGGFLDVATRSPYLAAGLNQDDKGLSLALRFPRGREGMNQASLGHSPAEKEPGAAPLLEPKGVFYSLSFYMDTAKIWEKRADLFKGREDQLKQFEEFEKNSGRFLFGTRLGQLFTYMGARHRLVGVQLPGAQGSSPDENAHFAYLLELRDPEKFMKTMEPTLRSVPLLIGFTGLKLKLIEEQYGGHKIVGYRFENEEKLKSLGPTFYGFLANTTPCFVRVGNQFILSTKIELARTMIDELEKEAKSPGKPDSVALRQHFYWSTIANNIASDRDPQITQAILNQGTDRAEAEKQVAAIISLLHKLGSVQADIHYDNDRFRYDIRAVTNLLK